MAEPVGAVGAAVGYPLPPNPLTEPHAFNVFTGVRLSEGGGVLPTAAALGLEPPRFCAQCGRRMIVQVRPDGWWSRCSRHGNIDSAELGAR